MSIQDSVDLDSFEPINAVIIDSERLFLDALRRLLDASPITVVGGGRNIEDALRSIRTATPLHLALCSFSSEVEALRELPRMAELRRSHPRIKLVVLTDLQQPDVLLAAIEAGAEALLSRDISSDVLRRALELVQLGQRMMPAELLRLLLDPASRPSAARGSPQEARAGRQDLGRAASLTPRECQILQCLMDGRSNKELARDLQLTEATVKAHVKALLRKTRMTNRTQAAIWAVTNNFHFSEAADGQACTPSPRTAFGFPGQRLLAGSAAAPRAAMTMEEVAVPAE
ncbi:response regulator transcription factor [Roseomonas frigidaquae]|uniref:Response regulator transcription factor n=1 Tax=Falsiroseomonas frigidaquae TaxID=487318 RepID=A0ABX1EWB6_9PROT|nr:response regulator transcription factor [Falsiroseomonas frigidaquae]NKE44135.1 response regulator transcription factor [Falsiroseomonas frigidaquae]